ncbi:MAG: hypothetical protein AMXMBFR84_08480 [Candidatus Hydrogenedentota bacterium]
MREWNPDAREYFEGYLRQVSAMATHKGEDGDDIESSLRDHLDRKLDEIGAVVVSMDDLREALQSVGSPDDILEAGTPAATPQRRESAPHLQKPTHTHAEVAAPAGLGARPWMFVMVVAVFGLSILGFAFGLVSGVRSPIGMIAATINNLLGSLLAAVLLAILAGATRRWVSPWVFWSIVLAAASRLFGLLNTLVMQRLLPPESLSGYFGLTSSLLGAINLLFLVALLEMARQLLTASPAGARFAFSPASQGSGNLKYVLLFLGLLLLIPVFLIVMFLMSFVAYQRVGG